MKIELDVKKAVKTITQYENDWLYLRNSKYIKRRYKNEFVAIKNKKILDHDPDPIKLIKRLRARHIRTGNTVIEFIWEKEPIWCL